MGRLRRPQHLTFIPLNHDPGQRIEADFGHVYVGYLEGRRQVPVFLATGLYYHAQFMMGRRRRSESKRGLQVGNGELQDVSCAA